MNHQIRVFLIIFFLFIAQHNYAQKTTQIQTTGSASYYGEDFHGLETSNGEFFNQDDFTAAHRTLPFNTIVQVTNKNNGKSAIVRINDRGPYVKSRIIDLSHAAAMKLGMVPFGVVPVHLQVLRLLDYVAFKDSLFNDKEVWDCFGNQISLTNNTVKVWKSTNWKHAFYISSQLAIDYKLDSVAVAISGSGKKRMYDVIVTGLDSPGSASKLMSKLKKDGYSFVGMYNKR